MMRVPRKTVVVVRAVGGLAVVAVLVEAVVVVVVGVIAVIVVAVEIVTNIRITKKANGKMARSFPVRLFIECFKSNALISVVDSRSGIHMKLVDRKSTRLNSSH